MNKNFCEILMSDFRDFIRQLLTAFLVFTIAIFFILGPTFLDVVLEAYHNTSILVREEIFSLEARLIRTLKCCFQ